MENPNCKNCMRFQTCKFVEKNDEFVKQMYPMFLYAESNNLDKIFYENAKTCRYFVDNEIKIDTLLSKIDSAKSQIEWLIAYVASKTRPAESTVECLQRVLNGYKENLK